MFFWGHGVTNEKLLVPGKRC